MQNANELCLGTPCYMILNLNISFNDDFFLKL